MFLNALFFFSSPRGDETLADLDLAAISGIVNRDCFSNYLILLFCFFFKGRLRCDGGVTWTGAQPRGSVAIFPSLVTKKIISTKRFKSGVKKSQQVFFFIII